MKINTLMAFALILCFSAVSVFGNGDTKPNSYVVPDTVPDGMKKTSDNVDVEDDAFSTLENDLDEMDLNDHTADTTKIRIGKMKIAVIDDGDDIVINKDNNWDNEDWDEDWSWNDDNNWTFHKKGKKDTFSPHWAGFAMGLNNYVTADQSTTLPDEWSLLAVNTNNSFEVNINFAQVGLNIIKQRVGLVTGVGLKWNNYKFRNPNTFLSGDSTVLKFEEKPELNGKMSKLTTVYLMIPLLIEFQIPAGDEEFYISGGVEGGLKLGAHTKIKTNDKSKNKDNSDFFTTSLDYRLTARLGYGSFGIYGAYSMMPLFEKGGNPELYPFTAGVSVNF